MNGIALIAGCVRFEKKSMLQGSFIDVEAFQSVFKKFNLNTERILKGEVKKEDFIEKLDEAIKCVKINGNDCLIVTLSTHGAEKLDDHKENRDQKVFFYDDGMSVKDILDKLKDPEIEHVKKLLFIVCCRYRPDEKKDQRIDKGLKIELVDDISKEYTDLPEVNNEARRMDTEYCDTPDLPLNSVLWYSSTSGIYSYSNKIAGSRFCEALCDILDKIPKPGSKPIMDIVLDTHAKLAKFEGSVQLDASKILYKTIPCCIHNLSESFDFIKI